MSCDDKRETCSKFTNAIAVTSIRVASLLILQSLCYNINDEGDEPCAH